MFILLQTDEHAICEIHACWLCISWLLIFTAMCATHNYAIIIYCSPTEGYFGCFQVFAVILSGSMNIHEHVSLKSLSLTKTFHMLLYSWAGRPFLSIFAHFLLILQVSTSMQPLQRRAHSPKLGYWGTVSLSHHILVTCWHFSLSHWILHSLRLMPTPVSCSRSVCGMNYKLKSDPFNR